MAASDAPPAPDDPKRGRLIQDAGKVYSHRWDETLRDDPRNRLALPRDAYYRSLGEDPPADPES